MTPHEQPARERDPRKIHRLDERNGRANIYKLWALCGKSVRTLLITRKGSDVTCGECLDRMAQETKEMIQGRSLRESFTQ